MGGSRGVGQGTGGPHPTPCKITGGYSFFLRSTGTDHPREAIGPQGSNCISRDSHTPICKIHIDDLKKLIRAQSPVLETRISTWNVACPYMLSNLFTSQSPVLEPRMERGNPYMFSQTGSGDWRFNIFYHVTLFKKTCLLLLFLFFCLCLVAFPHNAIRAMPG